MFVCGVCGGGVSVHLIYNEYDVFNCVSLCALLVFTQGCAQEVIQLLKQGFDPNTKDYAGWTPLVRT